MVNQGSSVSIHKKFKCWIHLNNFISFSWRHLLNINQSVRETKGISSFVVRSLMWLQSQDQKEILYSQCLPTPCLPTHYQFLYCNLDGSAVCRYFIFSAVQFYIWPSRLRLSLRGNVYASGIQLLCEIVLCSDLYSCNLFSLTFGGQNN